jgi:cytochrome b6-f complex iron-sulfur subunit
MATASPAKSRAASAEVATKEQVKNVEVSLPSRREFLYYIWGASIVLLLGEATAAFIWFALPRFKEGEFGGTFPISGGEVPSTGDTPASIPSGRFWLSNPDEGFVALYGVCTHLGCLPKWNDLNFRFECPCHGSKFQLNGRYIEGPAPRSMDRFESTVTFTNGDVETTNENGDPIPLNGRTIASVRVNTGRRIKRSGQN